MKWLAWAIFVNYLAMVVLWCVYSLRENRRR